MLRYAYEAYGALLSLHPDKRRHGACLERLPQTARTAPLGPLNIQNATTKLVNDTQACSVEYSQHEMISFHSSCTNCKKRIQLTYSVYIYIVQLEATLGASSQKHFASSKMQSKKYMNSVSVTWWINGLISSVSTSVWTDADSDVRLDYIGTLVSWAWCKFCIPLASLRGPHLCASVTIKKKKVVSATLNKYQWFLSSQTNRIHQQNAQYPPCKYSIFQ